MRELVITKLNFTVRTNTDLQEVIRLAHRFGLGLNVSVHQGVFFGKADITLTDTEFTKKKQKALKAIAQAVGILE